MRKNILIAFIAIIILLTAPWWLPLGRKSAGLSPFLTSDSIFWLGITLLGGTLCQNLLSNRSTENIGKAIRVATNKFISHWPIFLGLLLFSLYVVNRFILHEFMNSADEHSCYFLAECLRKGKLWATPHPLAEFFEVIHIGNKGGKWFSVYPPGWPLLFALALNCHLGNWVNPFLSLLSIFFFFKVGEKMFGPNATALGIFIMVTTPFFLFNNASYFSHTTCLLAISFFLYSYYKWAELRSVFWASLCAIAIGYGLGTRYLTMVAITGPFLIYEVTQLVSKRVKWNRSYLVFGIILLIAIVLILYYNYLITGNLFNAPNHYYHGWERLGFHRDYTFFDAMRFIQDRFFFLMNWVSPAFLLLYILSLFQTRKEKPRYTLCRYGFFYLVVGYIFYYSWGGNQYGPRYYFEGLPFLALACGDFIWRVRNSNHRQVQKFMTGILLVALVGNAYLLLKQGTYYEKASSERKALYVLAEETIRDPAIVFIRGFLGDTLVMSEDDAIRNRPDLQDKILYAHDFKDKNTALTKFYPNRLYFLGYYDRQAKVARLEPLRN